MKNISFNILVMPYENKYMALCRETGVIRAGETLEEARDAIFSATKTLVKAVQKDRKLEPSLTIGLPMRYRLLFIWTILKMITRVLPKVTMNKFLYQVHPIHSAEFSRA